MTKQDFKRAYKALQGPRDMLLEYSKGSDYTRGFLDAYGAFMREWKNPFFTVEFVEERIDEFNEAFDKGNGNDYWAGFVGCLLIIYNSFRR